MSDDSASSEHSSADAPSAASVAGTPLAARVERLEQQVQQLTELLSGSGARADDPAVSNTAPGPAQGAATPVPLRRDAGIEAGLDTEPTSPPDADDADDAADPDGDPLWALHALQQRIPAPGGVTYAGSVDVGLGHVEYQWGRPTEHLLENDWAEHADAIAALGHPLRLVILRRLLDAEHTVAQLVDELGLASTGVAYHHLSALQAGGWVTTPRRGTWTVPVTRIVPLLTIITALEKG